MIQDIAVAIMAIVAIGSFALLLYLGKKRERVRRENGDPKP